MSLSLTPSNFAGCVFLLRSHTHTQHTCDVRSPWITKTVLFSFTQTQLLSRLTSAHRGAARALQVFVTQLEDHDWSRGLPRTHQELTLLVRQLALCCAQLDVAAGQHRVPDSVKKLIRDMAVSVRV